MKKIFKTITITLMVILLVSLTSCALPSGTVALPTSQDVTPTETTVPVESKTNAQLAKSYEKLQGFLVKQEAQLNKVDEVIRKFQNKIDKLSENGLDTSSLETALTVFEGRVPAILSAHAAADDVLAGHAGFGLDGLVTDATSAKSTLETAAKSLKSAHELSKTAIGDLSKAMQDFKAANPSTTPEPTEESAD